jgi:GNAT superfamily N-acetyltransferase
MSAEVRRVRAASSEDMHLLRRFYDELYVPEFPDPDEREDLGTIERYLVLEAQGWYGPNNYHVLLWTDAGQVVAGSISDYLAVPDAGVVEFLVVSPAVRSHGLGGRVLAETERRLRADAQRAGGSLRCVYAEVDDPLRSAPGAFDARTRLRIWHRWGYRALDLPYVQPALSADQSPVDGLLLLARTMSPELADGLPSQHVADVLAEYMRWAMRIAEPSANAEYRRMRQFLDERERVSFRPLVEPDERLSVREITDPDDPELDDLIRVYEGVFDDPSTAVPGEEFRALLRRRRGSTTTSGPCAPERSPTWRGCSPSPRCPRPASAGTSA